MPVDKVYVTACLFFKKISSWCSESRASYPFTMANSLTRAASNSCASLRSASVACSCFVFSVLSALSGGPSVSKSQRVRCDSSFSGSAPPHLPFLNVPYGKHRGCACWRVEVGCFFFFNSRPCSVRFSSSCWLSSCCCGLL